MTTLVGPLPGELELAIVFNPLEHPRDFLTGRWREVADITEVGSMPGGQRVADLSPGTKIKTAKGKTFVISKHGKWTTVYPIDKDGKEVGKHTVLPPDTEVEVVDLKKQTNVVGKVAKHEKGDPVRHVDDPENAIGEILDKRLDKQGGWEYLVFWADSKSEVWAPEPFLMTEADYQKEKKAAAITTLSEVKEGGVIRVVSTGKLLKVGETKKWTTVYPVDPKTNKINGKHTVLKPETKVEVVKEGTGDQIDPDEIEEGRIAAAGRKHQKQVQARAKQGDPIPSDITIHTSIDLASGSPQSVASYQFTFPDGKKDRHEWRFDSSNPYSHPPRVVIVHQTPDGRYHAYWTQMLPGSTGVKDKVAEFEKAGSVGIAVHEMPRATSSRVTRHKVDWPKGSIKAILGDSLIVDEAESASVTKYLEDLERIPKHIAKRLKDRGVKIHVANRMVPDMDDAAHLRNIKPRGYAKGMTWQDSAGCYSPSNRFATAGNNRRVGSVSTVLHEVGHAIGDVTHLDYDPELRKHHVRLYSKLGPYYKQGGKGGQAGMQEMLAESTAVLLTDEARARKMYDDKYVDWLKDRIIAEPKVAKKGYDGLRNRADTFDDPDAWRKAVDKVEKNHDPNTKEELQQSLVAEYIMARGGGMKAPMTSDPDLLRIKNLASHMWNGQALK